MRKRMLLTMVPLLALSGCYISNPQFGADDFVRMEDTNGVPTYFATGQVGYEKAEKKVAYTINTACPLGNPQVIYAESIVSNVTDSNGTRRTSTSWIAKFTCTDVILDK